jgi:hypothetical protein
MIRYIAVLALTGGMILSSCTKKESGGAGKPATEAPAATQTAVGPHVFVHLKDGSNVPGTIVASSQTDMVVEGNDGIEHTIPLTQIKSVDYGEAGTRQPRRQASRERARQPVPNQAAENTVQATAPPQPPAAVTVTYKLPAGSEISVRTNETIDSATASEGQTFDAQITRDAKDADGAVVIPRGSSARIIIESVSRGGRFHGASDLVLDLQSVTINGRRYTIDTADISQKGKSGVGANKRTAEYTGGVAALGAIIGAIAGGGKGAAVGAGAGAGAGMLTQILTQGGSIKVPVESVLTFKLDKPLKVTLAQ